MPSCGGWSPVCRHGEFARASARPPPQVDQQGGRVGVLVGRAARDAREHRDLAADADVLGPDRGAVLAGQPDRCPLFAPGRTRWSSTAGRPCAGSRSGRRSAGPPRPAPSGARPAARCALEQRPALDAQLVDHVRPSSAPVMSCSSRWTAVVPVLDRDLVRQQLLAPGQDREAEREQRDAQVRPEQRRVVVVDRVAQLELPRPPDVRDQGAERPGARKNSRAIERTTRRLRLGVRPGTAARSDDLDVVAPCALLDDLEPGQPAGRACRPARCRRWASSCTSVMTSPQSTAPRRPGQ